MSHPMIGTLRHRLTLEVASLTSDGGGGAAESWVTTDTLWAAIAPMKGSEDVLAERIAGQISHVIHVRYRSDITPAMRFRLGDRVFEIGAVIDVGERRRFLECHCRERDL